MMSMRSVAAVLAAAALCACSGKLFEGKKIDYKSAGKAKPLDSAARSDVPRLPAIATTSPRPSRDPQRLRICRRPAAPARGWSALLPSNAADLRVERAGSQRWLVVDAEPEALWPVIKDFWQDTGFLDRSGIARGRHHGNRLGREPRQDSGQASCAARSGKVAGQRSIPTPNATNSARGWSAVPECRRDGNLHQPPRHGAGQCFRGPLTEKAALAGQARRSGARGGNAVARLLLRLGARDEQVVAPAGSAGTTEAQRIVKEWRASRIAADGATVSIVPGDAWAWRWIASALPSRTVTAPKACIFVRYVDLDATERGKVGGFLVQDGFWRSESGSKQWITSSTGSTSRMPSRAARSRCWMNKV